MATLRAAGCVFAEDEARLLIAETTSAATLSERVARRAAGIPLEQILGWVEFCGLRVSLDEGVFVPRARTQWLVTLALEQLTSVDGVPTLVELCCGAGAISSSLLHARPQLELHATDIDAAALVCARRNLEPLGGYVHEGDLFAALPRRVMGGVDVLIANAPYVPTSELAYMPSEARDFEPVVALDGGPDGLEVLRRLLADASCWLRPGGTVIAEASPTQAPTLLSIASQAGLLPRIATSEELGATALVATS